MANDELRVRICIACNGQFSDEPCEPSECDILRIVENLDPETLRPRGRWNIIECDKENKRIFVECECGATFKLSMFDFGLCYNYCPNCGAKMEDDCK